MWSTMNSTTQKYTEAANGLDLKGGQSEWDIKHKAMLHSASSVWLQMLRLCVHGLDYYRRKRTDRQWGRMNQPC